MNVASLRKAKGLNQFELAELMGVTQPTVSRVERGDDGCTLGPLRACAAALGVGVEDLFAKDRSPAERQLLAVFRALPVDRQRGWLDLAQAITANHLEHGPESP